MKSKRITHVIAPEGKFTDITPYKEYEVKNLRIANYPYLFSFNIVDDKGDKIFCLLNECAHLRGKNWIVKQN